MVGRKKQSIKSSKVLITTRSPEIYEELRSILQTHYGTHYVHFSEEVDNAVKEHIVLLRKVFNKAKIKNKQTLQTNKNAEFEGDQEDDCPIEIPVSHHERAVRGESHGAQTGFYVSEIGNNGYGSIWEQIPHTSGNARRFNVWDALNSENVFSSVNISLNAFTKLLGRFLTSPQTIEKYLKFYADNGLVQPQLKREINLYFKSKEEQFVEKQHKKAFKELQGYRKKSINWGSRR